MDDVCLAHQPDRGRDQHRQDDGAIEVRGDGQADDAVAFRSRLFARQRRLVLGGENRHLVPAGGHLPGEVPGVDRQSAHIGFGIVEDLQDSHGWDAPLRSGGGQIDVPQSS